MTNLIRHASWRAPAGRTQSAGAISDARFSIFSPLPYLEIEKEIRAAVIPSAGDNLPHFRTANAVLLGGIRVVYFADLPTVRILDGT